MQLTHFFHCYAVNAWEAIVAEHFRALEDSGLRSQLSAISVGVVGSPEARRRATDVFESYGAEVVAQADTGFEQLTILALQAEAKAGRVGDYVLYAHTKGVTSPSASAPNWRWSMTQALVGGWRACVSLLESHDAVGCHWLEGQGTADHLNNFFGGNFWWSTAKWLSRDAEVLMDTRYRAESWIGIGDPVVYDVTPGWPHPGNFLRQIKPDQKIIAITCVQNEVDIVGSTIGQLLDNGIDEVLVYDGDSNDGTREVLASFPEVTRFDDTCPYFRQIEMTADLVSKATERGADWIVCFDADEFWYAPASQTIAHALYDCQEDVVMAVHWQHKDWEWRKPERNPMRKVAFRPHPSAVVHMGSHAVSHPGNVNYNVLALREIQFRGWEHYLAKVEARIRTIDPSLGLGVAQHYRRLIGFTEDQLRAEFEKEQATFTCRDPIPSPRRPASLVASPL